MANFDNTTLQGVGIFFVILVNLIAAVRIWARTGQSSVFRWDDFWLIPAYCFYMIFTIAFLVDGPLMFRHAEFLAGGPDYPERPNDTKASKRLFLFAPMGFWFTLWSVKASFLALYKKMMIQLPLYIYLWWVVVIYCFLVTQKLFSCCLHLPLG